MEAWLKFACPRDQTQALDTVWEAAPLGLNHLAIKPFLLQII